MAADFYRATRARRAQTEPGAFERMLAALDAQGPQVPTSGPRDDWTAADRVAADAPPVEDPDVRDRYLSQRGWRGVSDAVFGMPDLVNSAANTGIEDFGWLTGAYKPGDAFQFGMPSQDAANLATEATGADIVPDEAVSAATQRSGANRRALAGLIPTGVDDVATLAKAGIIGLGGKLIKGEPTWRTVPTEGATMLPDKPMSSEDFREGSWLLPFYGDKMQAGKTLVDVNGKPVNQAMGGGGRFMQLNPGKVWASDQGKGTTVSEKVKRLEDESGLPVLGTHVSMGDNATDFTKATARILLQTTNREAISDAAAAAFDARMAAAGVTKWPGIKNVDNEAWLAVASGGDRAQLAKAMQLSAFAKDPAFGDVDAVRAALTEEELRGKPMLTSGMTVGQFAPGGKMEPGAGTNESYNTDWLGEHLGNAGQVPFNIMFPDVLAAYLAKVGDNPKATGLPNIGYMVERSIPPQKITPQWKDQAGEWWLRRNAR